MLRSITIKQPTISALRKKKKSFRLINTITVNAKRSKVVNMAALGMASAEEK